MRRPLRAGSYRGSMGLYRDNVASMQGLVVRESAKRRLLGGLGGLGDLCTDSGAEFFRALVSAAGAVTSSIGTSEGSSGATAAGAGLTTFGSAWQASCTPSGGSSTGVSSTDLEAMFARARDEAVADAAAARSSSDQALAMMVAMQAQQQQGGISTNTLLIGGAVLGVGLLAVLLLK